MSADLTLLFGAIDKLDCAINAYGCVMMELDDNPERQESREVATIKWLYEILREEADNIRGHTKILDEALNGQKVKT